LVVYYKFGDKKSSHEGINCSLNSVFTLGEVVLNDPEEAAFLE